MFLRKKLFLPLAGHNLHYLISSLQVIVVFRFQKIDVITAHDIVREGNVSVVSACLSTGGGVRDRIYSNLLTAPVSAPGPPPPKQAIGTRLVGLRLKSFLVS